MASSLPFIVQIYHYLNDHRAQFILAGYISTAMGLPIKLVAAVNQNGATHKILSTGIFEEPREVLRSSSCSMDIAVSHYLPFSVI